MAQSAKNEEVRILLQMLTPAQKRELLVVLKAVKRESGCIPEPCSAFQGTIQKKE